MRPIAVIAHGAVSALGEGEAAFAIGGAGAVPETAIRQDPLLAAAGLAKPFVARAALGGEGRDPAAVLLERATTLLVEALGVAVPDFRSRRLGVALGTSSGGMVSLTEALAMRTAGAAIPAELARQTPYFGPLAAFRAALGAPATEETQVLAACASSAVAIGIACRWLETGAVDLAIAGGYDAVSTFVAAGFESLGATSVCPSPFRVGRDGMALGEAAALLALARPESVASRPLGYVRGFGASSDAVHVTAPDRTGGGLARAATAALSDAGLEPSDVDLVSAHATSTPFNDAAEARALVTALGERAASVVVHPFKAIVGHTLGASSALEFLAALGAIRSSVAPAAAGQGELDPDARVRLLARNEAATLRSALKLSAAFGGANAALVASSAPGVGRDIARRAVSVLRAGAVRRAEDVRLVADSLRLPRVQVSRLDPVSAAVLAACHDVLVPPPELPPSRVGIVVGTTAAVLENNEEFHAKLRERGARAVEPRKFPATSPNLPAGQCTIAFGLGGPSFAVGAGHAAALEALLVAHDLVAAGDADAMVVVATEHVGPAVAALWTAAGFPVLESGAFAVLLGVGGGQPLGRAQLRAEWAAVRDAPPAADAAGFRALSSALSRLL